MYKSDLKRFDPESQFMLTYPGKRLPVSTGSPPGARLQDRSEAAPPDSSGRLDTDNDLTYKLDQTNRIPWQDSTANSGNLKSPPVLKFAQRESDARIYKTASPRILWATSWRENLPANHVSIDVNFSYRQTSGDLSSPGSHQLIEPVDTSQMRNTQHFTQITGTRKSDTYCAYTAIFSYPAKQARDVTPTPSLFFPPGQDVRHLSNLHSPPGNSLTFKSIIK